MDNSLKRLCILNAFDGLVEGLSFFSRPTKTALIYAFNHDDSMRIYDPQHLLTGHEPKLKELYIDSNLWRENAIEAISNIKEGILHVTHDIEFAGLISSGGSSKSFFYQMWFTEHHPDMCSTGPTERWLEHAAWLLSQDFSGSSVSVGTSGRVLQKFSAHAVSDFIIDKRSKVVGPNTNISVYHISRAILGISKTPEEGAWPRGELVFVEPEQIKDITFITKFLKTERPSLYNFKHVRKLLIAVQRSKRKLISNDKNIVGIATGDIPTASLVAKFYGDHGFLELNNSTIASFFNEGFHSTTRQTTLVHVEEILLDTSIPQAVQHSLYNCIKTLVHKAETAKDGCTLVIDLKESLVELSGHYLDPPLDLYNKEYMDQAHALTKIDGAVLIGADVKLHAFACLLDGFSVTNEDRSRGARFNSALRFSTLHRDIIIIVVSSDRPVSIIHKGVELNAKFSWKPHSNSIANPPLLEQWI